MITDRSRSTETRSVVNQSKVFMVLFDPESGRLLGKGGQWVTPLAFGENAPKTPDEVLGDQSVRDPQQLRRATDLSGSGRCINGELHFCVGDVCSPSGIPCP